MTDVVSGARPRLMRRRPPDLFADSREGDVGAQEFVRHIAEDERDVEVDGQDWIGRNDGIHLLSRCSRNDISGSDPSCDSRGGTT